jgi:hypothetical protein
MIKKKTKTIRQQSKTVRKGKNKTKRSRSKKGGSGEEPAVVGDDELWGREEGAIIGWVNKSKQKKNNTLLNQFEEDLLIDELDTEDLSRRKRGVVHQSPNQLSVVGGPILVIGLLGALTIILANQ